MNTTRAHYTRPENGAVAKNSAEPATEHSRLRWCFAGLRDFAEHCIEAERAVQAQMHAEYVIVFAEADK